MHERRKNKRFYCCFDVCVGASQLSPVARFVDVSEGGACLATHDEIPVGVPITVSLPHNGSAELSFTVRNVRRAAYGWFRYGLEFEGQPEQMLASWAGPFLVNLSAGEPRELTAV